MFALLGAVFSIVPADGDAITNIINTKHNLSVSGPGPIKALTESRICVFCHTPHNATPGTPLWNKEVGPQVYTFYTSPTLRSPVPAQPTGATKLCLSCHDGTTALGAVVNPAGGIAIAGGTTTIPPSSLSNIGLNLSSHHPVSFSYSSALPDPELAPSPPPNLLFGGVDDLHCTTCHDPHDDANGKFLAMDNRHSALCTACHQLSGWEFSSHATSTAPVAGILPIPPKAWPTWTTVAEWGCEVCHTPHFAENPQWLLNYTSSDFCLSCHSEAPAPIHSLSGDTVTAQYSSSRQPTSPSCRSCHGEWTAAGNPALVAAVTAQASPPRYPASPPLPGRRADIRGQIKKISSHGGQAGIPDLLHHPRESSRSMPRHATCVDCHNPHVASKQKASAPNASGVLRGVKGVDRNGLEIPFVTYEYELCFRCHADYNPGVRSIPRVVNTTNTRLAFDSLNPSYHPVVSIGRNLNIPSIPSSYEPSLNASNMIYCTHCHRDEGGGSKGPHGSSFAPILGERYETTDNTPESYENYALCYRCHSRESILSDASFQKKMVGTTPTRGGHSGHLTRGAPCSACHDPHGIPDNMMSGSHTHLINFDTRIVFPVGVAPNSFPVFNDTGSFSGSCTLVCHGVTHNNQSYP